MDDNSNLFEVVTDGTTPINELPRHIVEDEIGFFLYDENKAYRKGSMVVDIDTRWFYYCLQYCPVGTPLTDMLFFMPIPDSVVRERVNTAIENLTPQIDGNTFHFMVSLDITDKYFTVYMNGMHLTRDADFEVTGNTIRILFDYPPEARDILTVEYYMVSERTDVLGQISIESEDLSPQIDEGTNNSTFHYQADRVDCVNIFWNGLRLRQSFTGPNDNDYFIDRLNRVIEFADAGFTDGDRLVLKIYSPPAGTERRLTKHDIDLTGQISEDNTTFELGSQRIGDISNLFLNGVRLTKDLDYHLDQGANILQTIGWIPEVNRDVLILEVYQMI